jgi:beta-lactamase regulating signal transducer with metallopeptidase domain/protocatechuate 3,4-dioxygenase beta subunit
MNAALAQFESLLGMCAFQGFILSLIFVPLCQVILKPASAAQRTLVLTLGLLGILLLPAANLLLPERPLPLLPADVEAQGYPFAAKESSTPTPPPVETPPAPTPSPAPASALPPEPAPDPAPTTITEALPPSAPRPRTATLIWLAGVLAGGAVLARSALYLRRLRRESAPFPLEPAYPLPIATHPRVRVPMLLGPRRPLILLPENARNWPEATLRAVLLHETAHHRRRDIARGWLALAVLTLHWFNPFVWFLVRATRRETERACDDLVLRAGHAPADYAGTLLHLAKGLRRDSRTLAAASMVGKGGGSGLATRIRAILATRRNRRAAGRWLLGTTALLVLGTFGTAASLRVGNMRPDLLSYDPVTLYEPAFTPEQLLAERTGPDEIRYIEVTVVDPQGRPVEGAEVFPGGLRGIVGRGNHYRWHDVPGEPVRGLDTPRARTDAQGRARVPYPRYVRDTLPTGEVTVLVLHPDYLFFRKDVNVRKPSPPLQLKEGQRATIRVEGPAGTRLKRAAMVDNLLKGNYGENIWQAGDEPLTIRACLTGTYNLMAVAETEEGRLLFSDIRKVRFGESGRKNLNMKVSPGLTFRGVLSDNVPRPVKEGRVDLTTILRNNSQPPGWRTTAEVRPDGSFEVSDVPRVPLVGVTVECEGYISMSEWIDMHTHHPREFPTAGPQPATVHMLPTVSVPVAVLDAGGRPLPGAVVVPYFTLGQPFLRSVASLFPSQLPLDWRAHTEARNRRYRAVTGPDGIAKLDNLPPGLSGVSLQITKEGYSQVTAPPGERDLISTVEPLGNAIVRLQTATPQDSFREAQMQDERLLSRTPPASAPPPAPAGQPKVRVTIRGEGGALVSGAEVRLRNLQGVIGQSGYFPWPADFPATAVANAEGVAEIPYPAVVKGDLPTGRIIGTVGHPDYCTTRVAIEVKAPEVIYLATGTLVKAEVKIPEGAQVYRRVGVLATPLAAGTGQPEWRIHYSYEVHARLQPGPYRLIGVVELSDGRFAFSPPREFEAGTVGEAQITLQTEAGYVVRGRLADNVPRPIINGRVMAVTSEETGEEAGPYRGRLASTWHEWADVSPDGTFTLPPMPPGKLGLLALCDGYVSGHGNYIRFVEGAPTMPVVLEMLPTASAQVQVVDREGQPLAGARVFATPNQLINGVGGSFLGTVRRSADEIFPGGQMPGFFKAERAPPRFEALTDAAGLATITGLPPGQSEIPVSVSLEGYRPTVPPTDPLGRLYLSTKPGAKPKRVEMGPASASLYEEIRAAELARIGLNPPPRQTTGVLTTTGKPLEVEPGPEFRGLVEDAQGRPLAGVRVDAWTQFPGESTETLADGTFLLPFPDNAPEVFEVRFSKAGYSPYHITAQRRGRAKYALTLGKGPVFAGKVLDADGKPLANFPVRAWMGPVSPPGARPFPVWEETRTDGEGDFNLFVTPQPYTFELRNPATGEALRSENHRADLVRGEVIPLRLGRQQPLRLELVDAFNGAAVPGIRLSAKDYPGIEATSDANGVCVLRGLVPGDIRFEVSPGTQPYRRWYTVEADGRSSHRQRLTGFLRSDYQLLILRVVPSKDVIRVYLEKAVTVRGRLVDPEGKPFPNGQVNLVQAREFLASHTRLDGSFEFLIPAPHDIACTLVGTDRGEPAPRRWADGQSWPFTASPGQVVDGLEIRLTRPATIRGKAVDVKGEAVPKADVVANIPGPIIPMAKTADDGTFELNFLPPGECTLQVLGNSPNARPATTPVTLREGQTRDNIQVLKAERAAGLRSIDL